MKKVLIAHTADHALPPDGTIKNMHFTACSKNESITNKLAEQEFEYIFIDEQFERAMSLCRKVAIRFPETQITIMLNPNNSINIKQFIHAGATGYFFKSVDNHQAIKQIYSFLQEETGSEENKEITKENKHRGLIIADASEEMDMQLRILLTNKGYRIFEASNITETAYFIKSKNTQTILIDESVLEKNSAFIKSLVSLSESQKLKLLIIGQKPPAVNTYKTKNIQIQYINKSETTENMYNQILELLK